MPLTTRSPGLQLLEGVASGARVIVETGRHTEGDGPEWTTPFATRLQVSRNKAGIPDGVWVRSGPVEFDPRDQAEGEVGNVEFHGEEYILRVLEIDGRRVAESVSSGANSLPPPERPR